MSKVYYLILRNVTPLDRDLQYARLEQYRGFLEEKLGETITVHGTYVDLGRTGDFWNLDDLPALEQLVAKVISGVVDTVLVDIEIERPFRPFQRGSRPDANLHGVEHDGGYVGLFQRHVGTAQPIHPGSDLNNNGHGSHDIFELIF